MATGDEQVQGIGANGLPFVPNVATTSPSSTTTTVRETPGWNNALQRQEKSYDDQAAAASAENKAKVADAQRLALIFQAEAERQKNLLMAQDSARAEWQKRINDSLANLRTRVANASQEPTKFWDDHTAGERTMARIGAFVSALGAGISGQDNKALGYIKDQIEMDAKRKQARSERLFKLAEQSKGLVADAYRQKAEELADFDAQRVAGWDVAQKQVEAYTKSGLVPQLQAQGNAAIAAIQQEAAKARLQAEENRKTQTVAQSGHTVTTTGLGQVGSRFFPSSEDTKQGAMAESNMEDAKNLRELDQQGFAPSPQLVNEILDRQNVLMANQKKEGESAFRSYLGKLARGGGMPDSIFPEGTPQGTRDWWNYHMGTGHAYAMDKFRGNSWISEYDHTVAPFLVGRGDTPESIHKKNENLVNHVIHIGERVQEVSKMGAREKLMEGQAPTRAATTTGAQELKQDLIQAHKALLDPQADAMTKAAARRFISDHGKGQ